MSADSPRPWDPAYDPSNPTPYHPSSAIRELFHYGSTQRRIRCSELAEPWVRMLANATNPYEFKVEVEVVKGRVGFWVEIDDPLRVTADDPSSLTKGIWRAVDTGEVIRVVHERGFGNAPENPETSGPFLKVADE